MQQEECTRKIYSNRETLGIVDKREKAELSRAHMLGRSQSARVQGKCSRQKEWWVQRLEQEQTWHT